MLEELKTAERVVGTKQLLRALSAGSVKKVFVANDADPSLTKPVVKQCKQDGITVVFVPSKKQLGAACSIAVPAAVAAIL